MKANRAPLWMTSMLALAALMACAKSQPGSAPTTTSAAAGPETSSEPVVAGPVVSEPPVETTAPPVGTSTPQPRPPVIPVTTSEPTPVTHPPDKPPVIVPPPPPPPPVVCKWTSNPNIQNGGSWGPAGCTIPGPPPCQTPPLYDRDVVSKTLPSTYTPGTVLGIRSLDGKRYAFVEKLYADHVPRGVCTKSFDHPMANPDAFTDHDCPAMAAASTTGCWFWSTADSSIRSGFVPGIRMIRAFIVYARGVTGKTMPGLDDNGLNVRLKTDTALATAWAAFVAKHPLVK